MDIKILDGEYWWTGCVNSAHFTPYTVESDHEFSMYGGNEADQYAPVMVSSKGRYFWSDKPFTGKVKNGVISLDLLDDGELCEGYENLRGAYLAVMKKHFPFNGKMPDKLFFTAPQYNTWIELGVEQFEDRIIEYAESIVKNGFTPGVLMIDGGWQEDYGVYEYCNMRKIPHPKQMVDRLHELGFKVMFWVSPIVSSAGWRFKELRKLGYLCMYKDTETPAIRDWWSGDSCMMDLTNPGCVAWFHEKLQSVIDNYGVDGFKFDAGDGYFYRDDDNIYQPMLGREQTKAFNEFGEKYPFNEFRAAWNCGGMGLVARLHDKYHSWTEYGINTLIPHTITQGLAGYAYCCPDMVGGGILDCFAADSEFEFDQELFVRWTQASTFTAMMQMSIAPWRVLTKENYEIVKSCIKLHEKYGETFYNLGVNASKTGEPIVRHMCYEFPDCGFETCDNQFMLGSDILVAPVLVKGARTRDVILPKGRWLADDGVEYEGGQTITVDAPLERLPYFTKM